MAAVCAVGMAADNGGCSNKSLNGSYADCFDAAAVQHTAARDLDRYRLETLMVAGYAPSFLMEDHARGMKPAKRESKRLCRAARRERNRSKSGCIPKRRRLYLRWKLIRVSRSGGKSSSPYRSGPLLPVARSFCCSTALRTQPHTSPQVDSISGGIGLRRITPRPP